MAVDYIGPPEGVDHTLQRVQQADSQAILVQADATNTGDIKKHRYAAYDKFGPGSRLRQGAPRQPEGIFLSQYFVQRLEAARKPGRIINISSVHEDMILPNFVTYCMSKGGMRDLAVELGHLDVTVNNIASGAIETPIDKKLTANKGEMKSLLANVPLNRLETLEDVADLAAFLASDKAGYITGFTYEIDGGLMRRYHEQ